MTEKVITMCCVGREERRGRVEEPSDVREGHNQEVFVVPRAEEHLKVGGGRAKSVVEGARGGGGVRGGVREEEKCDESVPCCCHYMALGVINSCMDGVQRVMVAGQG
jgi:hypothetical protein